MSRCTPRGPRTACPAPRCEFDDPYGHLAERGRALIAGRLLGTIPPLGCGCLRCVGDPFEPAEVAEMLDHVSDREAVLYALDVVRIDRVTTCGTCHRASVYFADYVGRQGVYASGACPIHG